jgi:hypothetical protein
MRNMFIAARYQTARLSQGGQPMGGMRQPAFPGSALLR